MNDTKKLPAKVSGKTFNLTFSCKINVAHQNKQTHSLEDTQVGSTKEFCSKKSSLSSENSGHCRLNVCRYIGFSWQTLRLGRVHKWIKTAENGHFTPFFWIFSKLELFYKWKSQLLYMRMWDVKRFFENFAVLILLRPPQIDPFFSILRRSEGD